MPDDFWRKEWWHPVTVHFPIALLLVATLFFLIGFFLRGEYKKVFQNASFVLLIFGSIGAWVSLWTGDIADGIVARKLCDPTILKDHEIAAQTMTYLFTAAAILNILIFFDVFRSKLRIISVYVVFLLLLLGSGYLVYTGRLGASLVYQQGAGVLNHSVDCDE